MTKKSVILFCLAFSIIAPSGASAQAAAEAKASVVQDLSYDNTGFSQATGEASLYKEVESNSPLDRKVNIRVNNVSISAFLNSISGQAKINFIMGEEFAGKKVSASLANVTVREALDTLLRVQGLMYQRIGKSDSYVITKRSEEAPDVVTKVYTLNYVSLQGQSSASQNLQALMPKDTSTLGALRSGGGSSGTGLSGGIGGGISAPSSGGGGGSSSGGGNEGGSAILDIIKSVLTTNGKIAIDGRTNKLIITDVAEVFPQVENILAELDIKAPQILIEAQIVEVSKTSGFDVGFKWNPAGSFTAGSTELPWQYLGRPVDNGGIFKYFMAASSGTVSGKIPELNFSKFTVLFNAMMSNGEARSLGKPKVITMNNNPAVITASQEASIGSLNQYDSGSSSSSSTTTTSTAERRTIGLTLTVTPQVNKEGYVTLTVAPSYTNLKASSAIEGTYDPVTRAISTQVRVRSGQTVVLGGLLQSIETESVQKVPLLGQIPILGWLFTHKSTNKETTDLIIFLTPTVLSE